MQKKAIFEQFNDFRFRHGLSKKVITTIAEEYANGGDDITRSYFVEKYDISPTVFYRARDFAVICHLVDYRTAKKIFAKAEMMSRAHNSKKTATRSILHSEMLRKKRKEFLDSFTDADIENICRQYSNGVRLFALADQYDTGEGAIKILLKRGIVNGIADNATLAGIDRRLRQNGHSISEIFDSQKK